MTYVGAVRAALAEAGDPARAAQQQAYMKSELPYVGLGAAELRALLKPLLAEHRFIDRALWEDAVRELWDDATHREEWYAAIALLCLWISHYVLGFTSLLADNLSTNVVGLALGTAFRFVLYRYWVFGHHRADGLSNLARVEEAQRALFEEPPLEPAPLEDYSPPPRNQGG